MLSPRTAVRTIRNERLVHLSPKRDYEIVVVVVDERALATRITRSRTVESFETRRVPAHPAIISTIVGNLYFAVSFYRREECVVVTPPYVSKSHLAATAYSLRAFRLLCPRGRVRDTEINGGQVPSRPRLLAPRCSSEEESRSTSFSRRSGMSVKYGAILRG